MTIINSKFLGLAAAVTAFAGLVQLAACTSDNGSDTGGTGGTANPGAGGATAGTSAGGSATAGTSTGGSSAGTSAGGSAGAVATVCAHPTVIPSASPGIANFESYDGAADFQKWSFPLGGMQATGVMAGTFSYSDRKTIPPAMHGFPETSEMSAGYMSTYAMHIADTDPNRMTDPGGPYGGGMGLWLSTCLDGSAFQGVSFYVKGSTPKTTTTFTLSMKETLSASSATNPGTCSGTDMTCHHPYFDAPVTSTWTQVQIPWSMFTAGDANGTPVTPDGKDIVQFQWSADAIYAPTVDGGTDYEPIPATYDLAIDNVTFY